jgi:acyl carrier protein
MNVVDDLKEFIFERKMVDSIEAVDAETFILEVIDSLSIIKIINYIEARYKINVDEDDLTPENFENLMAIQDLVGRKIKQNPE